MKNILKRLKKILAKQMKQEGLKRGREEGKKEVGRDEKLSIARGILQKEYKVDAIMYITGMPKVTVNKLYKDL